MNKKIAVLILMLFAAGILIVAAMSIRKSLRIKKNGVETESIVQSTRTNSKSHLKSVTVVFKTSEGKEVTATASTRQFVNKGESVKIWYDPASPQTIDFGDTIRYNMRGVIIGGLLFLFGLYYFIKFSLKDNADSKLLRSGKKISAESVEIVRDERYRMGDSNPWIIKCKWIDNINNKEYEFVSKDYTIDPAPYLQGRSTIDVFINPEDPGKYFMDTSFMPKGNNTIG